MAFQIMGFVIFLFLMFFLLWSALRGLIKNNSNRSIALRLLLAADGIVFLFLLVWFFRAVINDEVTPSAQYRNFMTMNAVVLLWFLPRIALLPFVLVNLANRIVHYLFSRNKRNKKQNGNRVYWMVSFAAMALIWGLIAHGIFFGKAKFQLQYVMIESEEIPEAFDGFKIVQISDLHLGSFRNHKQVIKGLDLIKDLDFDILVLTGDIINNHYSEFIPYQQAFGSIEAARGKYAILGNHDLGDYRKWYTRKKTDSKVDSLVILMENAGIRTLRNQHTYIEKAGDSLLLAGVDNWGLPPFSPHGDLQAALNESNTTKFSILLSHDPSHWQAQVIPQSTIHLTLSGHSHAMQMGINSGPVHWSPASLVFDYWNGLYFHQQRMLYVNRGFGFLGFPGRMGMYPEITLLELKRKSKS